MVSLGQVQGKNTQVKCEQCTVGDIKILQSENILSPDCLGYDYVIYIYIYIEWGFYVYTLVENNLGMELLSVVIIMGGILFKGLYTYYIIIFGPFETPPPLVGLLS